MGVTVTTRVQGWVSLYEGIGMGATVLGYRDGCHCEGTGISVPVSGYRDWCHYMRV